MIDQSLNHEALLEQAVIEAKAEIEMLYPKEGQFWKAKRQRELPRRIRRNYLIRVDPEYHGDR